MLIVVLGVAIVAALGGVAFGETRLSLWWQARRRTRSTAPAAFAAPLTPDEIRAIDAALDWDRHERELNP